MTHLVSDSRGLEEATRSGHHDAPFFWLMMSQSVTPTEKGLLLLLLRKPLSRLLAAPKFIRQRAKLELTMDGTRTETANNSRAAGVVLEFEMSTR